MSKGWRGSVDCVEAGGEADDEAIERGEGEWEDVWVRWREGGA